jgi:cytochrome d ubiquinol oxidase subunit II
MIDYEILRVIWWLFIGVILVGFCIMDGQDMGVGTLLPFLGKNDTERRCMINAVAPHWDGNQVWLITGGAGIFAAWPLMYAVAFSGFYWAMLIVLAALILRPVGFDFRSKLEATRWRDAWDKALFIGSAVPPVIFGVAFGNLLMGVPFHFTDSMHPVYTGSFFGLLNPFSLLCGIISLAMTVYHGGNYLALRTEGSLQERAQNAAALAGTVTCLLFVLAGIWVYFGIDGLVVTGGLDPDGPSNPMLKTVESATGAWFANFWALPALFAVPGVAVAASLAGVGFVKTGKSGLAIVCSSLTMLGIVLTPLIAIFPFVLPSSSVLNASLTLWDCTSSQLTLEVMFFVVVLFLPIVLAYTGWAYKVMSGKLTARYIAENDHMLY